MKITDITLDLLRADPNQPRKVRSQANALQLRQSLASEGQRVPIIVFKDNGFYTIAEGESRFLEAKQAGLTSLAAVVLDSRPSDAELLRLQLTVNCVRYDLNPLDKTEAYLRLMELGGLTPSQLAKELATSNPSVTRILSLARLSEEHKDLVRQGKLTSAKAYALARMDADERDQAIKLLSQPASRELFERKARKKRSADPLHAGVRNFRYELPDCTLAVRASNAMDVDAFIDILSDLLRACRKAKSQKIDLSTMALMLRDQTRRTQPIEGSPQ